jgi:hypothetical protein
MRGMNWLFGFALLAVCILGASPAQALESGVYMVEGTSNYYFVDDEGFRHVIQDPATVRTRWFADRPVLRTTSTVIDALPAGDVITEDIGPDKVVKRKKTTTVTDENGDTTTRTEESTEVTR